jgi:hypothetical protein
MNTDSYDVYFSGVCLKTADPAEVKRKIGALFKLEGEKLDRLFSGKPIPIKRGVDMDQAVKFRVSFRDAGALVDIVPTGQPAPVPRPAPAPRPAATEAPNPATSTPAAAAGTNGLSLADGPLPAAEGEQAPSIPIPDYDLSAPKDFNLSDCTPAVEPAPIPDISGLDLDKPGATLDEHPDPAPLEIDIDALSLDDTDTPLEEERELQPPQIDTQNLTLSAPREGSLEAYQKSVEPAPLPNIDHLKLDENAAAKEEKSLGKATFQIADD